MPILTRAQKAELEAKQNPTSSKNNNNNSSIVGGLSPAGTFERAAGKRVPKPTEFFEITIPARKPRQPKRREREEEDDDSSSDESTVDGISSRNIKRAGGISLPPRAARLEFERRIKRGNLEDPSSSSSSSSSSDDDDSSDDKIYYDKNRNASRKIKKSRNKRRGGHRNNNRDSSSSSSDDELDLDDLPTPRKNNKNRHKFSKKHQKKNDDDSDEENSNKSGDDSDDTSGIDDGSTDEHGEIDYDNDAQTAEGVIDCPNPREIERAMSSRISINTKLADLLEAHRSKLEMLKKGSSGRGGGKSGSGGSGKNDGPKNIDIVSLEPVSFADVGGVPDHIVSLREMLLLPLTYPHLFKHLNIKTPRGVLFVGSPGNGKTLMARALAHECSKVGPGGQKVTFFARKGADIMSKWVGEGERQLAQLFEEARRLQPSIIFFDEIDGLAPVRHMKQESSHASVVSTLLALMDGLDDRGQIVIIGATNRPDTLDPALRRPGRFDRELRFDYPNQSARHQILSIHTKKWNFKDADLHRISEETHGFAGADLSALCAEASLVALRRFCPHMFVSSDRYDIDTTNLRVTVDDFLTAIRSMTPSSHRSRNMMVMNDTPLRQCLSESTTNDVLVALRKNWHSITDEAGGSSVDTADTEACFLKLVRPPTVQGMCSKSALILFTVQSAIPKSSSVEAAAACNIDFLGRTFPNALVVSFNFASGHVAGIEPSLLEHETNSVSVAGGTSSTHFALAAALLSYTMKHRKAIIVLTGIESLPTQCDENVDAALRWMFDAVSHRDTALIVPTSTAALDSHAERMESLFGPTLWQHVVQQRSPGVRVGDVERALDKVIIPDLCASCVKSLPDAPPLVSREQIEKEQREMQLLQEQQQLTLQQRVSLSEEWHKIAYKRTQLRQTLRETLMSLLAKGSKFEMFQGEDLDLEKGSRTNPEIKRLLKLWRKHYAKHPMNLTIISEKLDQEKYVAISQFNTDIETICNNVFRFFSTDKASRRYRDRAKQMKEEVLLANYKINRSVALFCEDHIEVKKPGFLGTGASSRGRPPQSQHLISPIHRNQQQTVPPPPPQPIARPILLDDDDDHTNNKNKNNNNNKKKDKEESDESEEDDDEEEKQSKSYRSRSASRPKSGSKISNALSVNSKNSKNKSSEKKSNSKDAADDEESSSASDESDSDNEESFPPHGLRIRTSVSSQMHAELLQALRQLFKIPASKASFNDPVNMSLNRCEQLLVFDFLQHNDKVKKIRAKLEGSMMHATPESQVPTVASGSSAKRSTGSLSPSGQQQQSSNKMMNNSNNNNKNASSASPMVGGTVSRSLMNSAAKK